MRKRLFVCVCETQKYVNGGEIRHWLTAHWFIITPQWFLSAFPSNPRCQKNQKAVEQPCRNKKSKYVTIITKSHIWGFWQDNKQANCKTDKDRNCNNGKKRVDILSDLQSLYSTVWLSRNKLRELNQCDRANDCFCLLNAVCGAAGPQGPQVTLRLPVIST